MLSLLKKFFENVAPVPLQAYQTRVVEVVFGDGSVKYSPQMTTKGPYGRYVWGGILVFRNEYNDTADRTYPHLTLLEYITRNTVDTKETACKICEEFKAHVLKDVVVSCKEVECCKPRVINK